MVPSHLRTGDERLILLIYDLYEVNESLYIGRSVSKKSVTIVHAAIRWVVQGEGGDGAEFQRLVNSSAHGEDGWFFP